MWWITKKHFLSCFVIIYKLYTLRSSIYEVAGMHKHFMCKDWAKVIWSIRIWAEIWTTVSLSSILIWKYFLHTMSMHSGVIIFFSRLFIIERQRETGHEHGRGTERRGRGIWSRLQALSYQHRARCGAQLKNHEIMTWADVGCLTDWATQAPL